MAIDKRTCESFRTDLNAALEALREKYNMDIQAGNIRYSASTLSIKLDCADLSGDNDSLAQAEFNRNCIFFGLAQSHFGKQFTDDRGNIHKIVGIKPRSKKYPILTRNITANGPGDSATTKWNATTVKGFLNG